MSTTSRRSFGREIFDVPCTIEIENTFDSLHAHVDLDGEVLIGPGDVVLVKGALGSRMALVVQALTETGS